MTALIFDLLINMLGTTLRYYTYLVMLVYLVLILLAILEMYEYKSKNGYVNYYQLLSSPFSPSISVIAPAYNESGSIIENINSLQSLYYNNYEVIVVNDGSKDDMLEKVIQHFDMVKVPLYFDEKLSSQKIRGIYKPRKLARVNLTLVDKENGGKADALNAGINISSNELIACIDVDCILERDCLLKMVKPFLEKGKKVIATGGTIRVANESTIRNGRVLRTVLPRNFVARMQINEYLRAFLVGRMAWSHVNGLLLVSGALGLFDRKTVIDAGGYNPKTVGEDMELVVRMRRLMVERKIPSKVVYTPEPLCWTEVPSSFQILGKQRNRWTRGSIETLNTHGDMLFNRKYGVMGMFSFPVWMIIEWLAPFVESFGFLYILFLIVMGHVTALKFLILFVFLLLFSSLVSSAAILLEEIGYPIYRRPVEIFRLLLLSTIEPFLYHPRTVYWGIKGNIDYLRGVKSWGAMERKGFDKKQ